MTPLFIGNIGIEEMILSSVIILLYLMRYMSYSTIAKGILYIFDIAKVVLLGLIGYYIWTNDKGTEVFTWIFYFLVGLSIFYTFKLIRNLI